MNRNGNNHTDTAPEKSLQEQVEKKKAATPKLFGTFGGVFTPTLLTILGVIMYLREGWVVGNAGLLGAWLIIILAFAITTCTGLSMSSVTTNIRIGAGGAFSIISQSLGLEVGGSIGIPLYLAQALAVAMYIFGFRAGWQYIFPHHPALLVDFGVFLVLFFIAFISANLAFRVQYLIMAVIFGSLTSVAVAAFSGSMQHPVTWWGSFPGSLADKFSGTTFWMVFAVFFPAATGIMAGANMSGELKNPRRSIPVGTLSAIGVSLAIYLALAYWLARSATNEELLQNYNIMIDRAAWAPVVLAGLLGATFSSALSSLVGSPRILQALGERNILPFSPWFARRSRLGEPRNALLLTGGIVFVALMLRNLNAIAPLITMFFLLTYAMINLVVIIEQSLKLVSFRPLFRIPRPVALLGFTGCILAMFIINPVFSLVALTMILIIHAILLRRHLKAPFGDVRSGLFVAVAEWAARKVNELTATTERAWKANLLIPVQDPHQLRGTFHFIKEVAYPRGSIKIVGLTGQVTKERFLKRLPFLTQAFQNEGVFSSWTVIDVATFGDNLVASMEALGGAFFKPNVLFLTLPSSPDQALEVELHEIILKAFQNKVGVMLLANHPQAGLGRRHAINVWVDDRSPNWELTMDLGNLDLALLIAYKLKRNWPASLNLIATVKEPEKLPAAQEFLDNLVEMARLPHTKTYVFRGDGIDQYSAAIPLASLNIFGLSSQPDFASCRHLVQTIGSACLFTLDSGEENALA
jgi:solute carrier family 12 (sodium/potassium/chloride transporter), member 2